MRQRLLTLLLLVWLSILALISYGPSLGLSLYGDDWLVIGKYFANTGSDRTLAYKIQQVYVTNYGPQFVVTGNLYSIFGENPLPYFVISLVLRILSAYALFWFVKRISSINLAITVATLYSVAAGGAETTDWVYNMTSYLAISFLLFGLGFFVVRKTYGEGVKSWILMILGYMTAIIRTFILPFVAMSFVFADQLLNRRQSLIRSVLIAFSALLPFLLVKYIFPGMGFQNVNSTQISDGLKQSLDLLKQSKFDFLLMPFIYIGEISFPFGISELGQLGFSIFPFIKFVLIGGLVGLFGTLMFRLSGTKLNKSVIGAYLTLVALKVFEMVQKNGIIVEFSNFVWAYIGITLSLIVVKNLYLAFRRRRVREVTYYMTLILFVASFFFGWWYDLTHVPVVHLRYFILPTIGVMMMWGVLLFPKSELKKVKIILAGLLVFINIVSVRSYFDTSLKSRQSEISNSLYKQLKDEVPYISQRDASVFYFENMPPLMFEQLFRFGFGYHMQLFYTLPFNEQNFPYGVSKIEDLKAAVTDPNFVGRTAGSKEITSIRNVYAFRLEGDRIVNVTNRVREHLENETTNLQNR